MKEWLLQEFSLSFPSFSLCIPFFFHSTFFLPLFSVWWEGFSLLLCANDLHLLQATSRHYWKSPCSIDFSLTAAEMLTNTRIHKYTNVHDAPAQQIPANLPLEVFFCSFPVFIPSTVADDIWIFIDNNLRVPKAQRHQCHCRSRESSGSQNLNTDKLSLTVAQACTLAGNVFS